MITGKRRRMEEGQAAGVNLSFQFFFVIIIHMRIIGASLNILFTVVIYVKNILETILLCV